MITGDIEGNKASVGGGIYIENIYQINETKIDQQIKFINNTANCYGNDRATSIASIEWQKAPPLGIAPEIQFFSVEIGLFDSFQQSVNCISEFLEIKLSSRGSSLIGELTQVYFIFCFFLYLFLVVILIMIIIIIYYYYYYYIIIISSFVVILFFIFIS